jgi:hypothetical protein
MDQARCAIRGKRCRINPPPRHHSQRAFVWRGCGNPLEAKWPRSWHAVLARRVDRGRALSVGGAKGRGSTGNAKGPCCEIDPQRQHHRRRAFVCLRCGRRKSLLRRDRGSGSPSSPREAPKSNLKVIEGGLGASAPRRKPSVRCGDRVLPHRDAILPRIILPYESMCDAMVMTKHQVRRAFNTGRGDVVDALCSMNEAKQHLQWRLRNVGGLRSRRCCRSTRSSCDASCWA